MKRKLIYALPLAGLLATATVGRLALAEDTPSGSSYGSSGTASDPPMNPSGRSSSASAAVSDAAITAKVKSALLAERNLPSTQISVQTNDGVVQLSGFLGSQDEIDRAVSIARNVKDVKSVENNIQTSKTGDMPTQ